MYVCVCRELCVCCLILYTQLYTTITVPDISGYVCCFSREISDTQAAMKSVEESKLQLLTTTNELHLKLEASISVRLPVCCSRICAENTR